MKKGIIISVIGILLIAGLFIFSSQYRAQQQELAESLPALTTVATTSTTTTTSTTQKLTGVIAENEEGDYQLHNDDGVVTLVHGDYSIVLNGWSWSIEQEIPTLHYADFDSDGSKELIIRAVTSSGSNKVTGKDMFVYSLYLFKPITNSEGEKTFNVYYADTDTWKTPFEKSIQCELTQLKSCVKTLQFTMDNKGDTILYDEETGITSNKYAGYASAKKSSDGNYYSIKDWSKDLGIYTIDDEGNITLDIQVVTEYNETSQLDLIGYIHCDISVSDNVFGLNPGSIEFQAYEGREVSDPRKIADTKFSVVINNGSEASSSNIKTIQDIEATFDVASLDSTQTQYFSQLDTDINYIDSVEFTNTYVKLTAKKGYSFSTVSVNDHVFTVTAESSTGKTYDIGYLCGESTENNKEVLTITFDKSYQQENMKNVTISFGG